MYRSEDYELIKSKIDELSENATKIYLNTYEPTLDEFKSVYEIIKNFIREKKRIVYGGYAQDLLIKAQNKNDGIYKETDLADIEFYTHEPLKDLIELCDMLYDKKYKHIEGKEGIHPETYKLFVNFINYSDITYIPKNIFDRFPTIKVDGLLCTHPHFMLIDAFRVYTDPMTSYFRLDKTFKRFTKIYEYYPFNSNSIYNKIEYTLKMSEKEHTHITRFIRKNIIHHSKLIVVGHYAFNRLMKLSGHNKYIVQEPFYQVISINYEKDSDDILKKLEKEFPKKISVKRYHPFYQHFDKSIEYYYNEQIILRIYGNNERCIPYDYSFKKKTNFGTSQLVMLYLLGNYNISIIRNNKFNQMVHMSLMTRLLKTRDNYLQEKEKTILDKTIFEEFTLKCMGEAVNPIRASLLSGLERKKQGKQMKFAYRPKGSPGKVPNYKFNNTSGNEIRN
jgi:hypothetical protein